MVKLATAPRETRKNPHGERFQGLCFFHVEKGKEGRKNGNAFFSPARLSLFGRSHAKTLEHGWKMLEKATVSAGTVTVETDSLGYFTLSVEHSGSFDLTVNKTKYTEYSETIDTDSSSISRAVGLSYDGYITTISGVITSSDLGEGVEGAIVVANDSFTQTDSNGGYALTVRHQGTISFLVSKNDYTSHTETITSQLAVENKNLTLTFTGVRPTEPVVEYTTVSGQVFFTGTQIPVTGVTVECGEQSFTTDRGRSL